MRRYGFCIYAVILAIAVTSVANAEESSPWNWSCVEGSCTKIRSNPGDALLSLDACKITCNENGLLWPIPTGEISLGKVLSKLDIDEINVHFEATGKSDSLKDAAVERFKKLVQLVIPCGVTAEASGISLHIYLNNANPDVTDISLEMDESYNLTVEPNGDYEISATINANSFFGIRHGLETLSQLIIFDDFANNVLIVRDVSITDKPVYPYRGLLLDTSRNYYTIESIKSTIDAMAAVKLNTFHWHITDSQSFPFVSERRPNLAKLGAYSPSQVYTKETVQDIVQYGRVRGVRVLPELDAPAHVGEGWQDTDLTVCFKAEPWTTFCSEPPCGQFNPSKDELYNYLEDVYTDMAESFGSDLFHIGGDEVNNACWNSSTDIQNFMTKNGWGLENTDFLKLWDYFLTHAQEKAYKAFGKKVPLILWSSTLTDFNTIDNYLNKDDYIIQAWTTATDPQIPGLLNKGYRLILSNYDALYFDCGFGSWVSTGNNWCSPYIGWTKVYENSPAAIAVNHTEQILGAEAALWSEEADTASLDGRLWPRASALAERLWAEPSTSWSKAVQRMLYARERLIRMGIQSEALQPQWCAQNEGLCTL